MEAEDKAKDGAVGLTGSKDDTGELRFEGPSEATSEMPCGIGAVVLSNFASAKVLPLAGGVNFSIGEGSEGIVGTGIV